MNEKLNIEDNMTKNSFILFYENDDLSIDFLCKENNKTILTVKLTKDEALDMAFWIIGNYEDIINE